MITAHKFRFASSCAVVALCCLPCVGTARAQGRSAQTPDKPLFADDLTRPKLGDIPHLDVKVTADVRMTPDPNSHMVVMGAKTDVWCPSDKFIELKPNLNIVGFTPVTFTVYDGLQVRSYGVDTKEILRIDPPVDSNRKVVYVKTFDAQGHDKLLMQCIVRNHIANPAISALDYKEHDEKCGFAIKDRQSFTNTCLYLGDMYLGRVGEDAGKVDMDERLLPPGKYTCQMAGQNSDGIYVPGATSEFTVPPRYKIACVDDTPTIVIGEHADEKLKVTVKHTPGLSIVKTRVYIAGIKAGEAKGDDFTMALPMHDVPTGKCFIEVIGIAEDGVTYPVESLSVTIKNEPWEQRLYHTLEYEHIEDNKAQINKLWQEVCSNLERAKYEPSVYNDSTTFTLYSITEHYAVGDSAKYQAAAKKAFIQMTQLQLQSGKLYVALKMRGKASSLFELVISELGTETSPDREDAKKLLKVLRTDSAPAPTAL